VEKLKIRNRHAFIIAIRWLNNNNGDTILEVYRIQNINKFIFKLDIRRGAQIVGRAITTFPFFVIPLQLHYRLWLKSRYKCFEEFDRDQLEERILQTDQLKNASKHRLQHRFDRTHGYRSLRYTKEFMHDHISPMILPSAATVAVFAVQQRERERERERDRNV